MIKQIQKLKRLVIQVGHHLRHLLEASSFDKVLLLVASILIITVRNIADFLTSITEVNSWVVGINIYRLAFLILIYVLRAEFILWLGSMGFRIVYYLLCNHFIDLYMGYDSWSISDTLTVVITLTEVALEYYGRKRVILYLLYLSDRVLLFFKDMFI